MRKKFLKFTLKLGIVTAILWFLEENIINSGFYSSIYEFVLGIFFTCLGIIAFGLLIGLLSILDGDDKNLTPEQLREKRRLQRRAYNSIVNKNSTTHAIYNLEDTLAEELEDLKKKRNN